MILYSLQYQSQSVKSPPIRADHLYHLQNDYFIDNQVWVLGVSNIICTFSKVMFLVRPFPILEEIIVGIEFRVRPSQL